MSLGNEECWAVETSRVFGVPTFVTDQRSVFVRLMRRAADGPSARATLDRVLDMVESWSDLNEFKATRIPR